jgi:hypothetical protein
MNRHGRFVPPSDPGRHLSPQSLEVPDPPVQTLPFQLGHVQPTGMGGSRMQTKPFFRRQDQVQGPQGMRVEIVTHPVNPLGRGKDLGPPAPIRLRSTSRQPRSGSSTMKRLQVESCRAGRLGFIGRPGR